MPGRYGTSWAAGKISVNDPANSSPHSQGHTFTILGSQADTGTCLLNMTNLLTTNYLASKDHRITTREAEELRKKVHLWLSERGEIFQLWTKHV